MARIVGVTGLGAGVLVGQMSSAAAYGTRTAAGVLQRADVSAEVVLGGRDWPERPSYAKLLEDRGLTHIWQRGMWHDW